MQIILPIIASVVIIYIWIWLVNTIFSEKRVQKVISLKILFTGIVLVGSLFAYTFLDQYIPQLANFQLQLASITPTSLLGFVIYSSIVALLITLLINHRKSKVLQIVLIGALFFLAIAYGSFFLGINTVIVYYLVSAYAEEFMKYSTGSNLLAQEQRKNQTDLILLCILIALGFSLVENLLYIGVKLLNHENINIASMLIGRGLISTLIHVVSTWLIAFITIHIRRAHNLLIPTIIALLAWFALHTTYNIGLNYQLSYLSVPVIILSFFLLSYLFFKSDRLYKKG